MSHFLRPTVEVLFFILARKVSKARLLLFRPPTRIFLSSLCQSGVGLRFELGGGHLLKE